MPGGPPEIFLCFEIILTLDLVLDEVVVCKQFNKLNEGEAGFIAVDREGNISMETNTGSMFRASQSEGGEKAIAIWK